MKKEMRFRRAEALMIMQGKTTSYMDRSCLPYRFQDRSGIQKTSDLFRLFTHAGRHVFEDGNPVEKISNHCLFVRDQLG